MGSQTLGDQDGDTSSARFNDIKGLAYDGDSNLLFLSDTGSNKVKYIDTTLETPTTTTLPNVGTVSNLLGMTVYDSPGDKYLFFIAGPDIARITIDNINDPVVNLNFAGTGANEEEENAFNNPRQLIVIKEGIPGLPAGVIIVADTDNYHLKKVSSTGTVLPFSGLLAENSQYNHPDTGCDDPIDCFGYTNLMGVTKTANNSFFVIDKVEKGNSPTTINSIRRIGSDGLPVKVGKNEFFMTGLGPSQCDGDYNVAAFQNPTSIVADQQEDQLFLIDHNTVRRIILLDDLTGVADTIAGKAGTSAFMASGVGTAYTFDRPQAIEIHGNSLYIGCKSYVVKVDFQSPTKPTTPTLFFSNATVANITYGNSNFDGGALFHHYYIYLERVDTSSIQSLKFHAGVSTYKTISISNFFTGLVPGKEYRAYSTAHNRIGTSAQSDPLTFTTPLYCQGVYFSNPMVCSGHGTCQDNGDCSCSSHYSGSNCTIIECFGGFSNQEDTVCGGHGNCTAPDTCTCEPGYSDTQCDKINCYGTISNQPGVCSSHGTCVSPNNCSCSTGYVDDQCQTPVCYNIAATNNSVCSTNGTCTAPDTCNCESGHEGDACEFVVCFGTRSNSPAVCSSHGSCISPNGCLCEEGYTGNQCQFTICGSKTTEDADVCSNHGTCGAPNTCTCQANYVGAECEFPVCFGTASNESTVCSTNGTCTAPDTCSCSSGFEGNECQFINCHGTNTNNPNVCSGHGQCIDPNTCVCQDGYISNECNLIVCYDKLSNDPTVCSGHGSCTAPDTCSCQTGYLHDNCSVINCFGSYSNESNVCSTNGTCTAPDTCSCSTGFEGNECQFINCHGTNTNNPNVCTGHGQCIDPNTCVCQDGYISNECNIIVCFDQLSNESSICSGHGTCNAPDSCSCSTNYGGVDCNITSCNGVINSNSSVCSGHGACREFNTCECQENFYGINCDIVECNGVFSNNSDICGGHGTCQFQDNCECLTNYTGTNCSVFSCFGTDSGNNSVCSGHGSCTSHDTCECADGFGNVDCGEYTCYDIAFSLDHVCSSHGTCTSRDTCVCDSPSYTGPSCNIWQCFGENNDGNTCNFGNCTDIDTCSCASGYFEDRCTSWNCSNIIASEKLACSGHGTCVSPDVCQCATGYFGSTCQNFTCAGLNFEDTNVCSGFGQCVSLNNCSCIANRTGENCEIPLCGGIPANDATVCSGRGNCTGINSCACSTNYIGETCNLFTCYGVNNNDPNVCSGNGECIAHDTCRCNAPEYVNQFCNVTVSDAISINPSSGIIVTTRFYFEFSTAYFTTPLSFSTYFVDPNSGEQVPLLSSTTTNAIYPPVLGDIEIGANVTTQFGTYLIKRVVRVSELTNAGDKPNLLEDGSGGQNLQDYYQRSCLEQPYLANLITIYSAVNISFECSNPNFVPSTTDSNLFRLFEQEVISDTAPRCSLSALFQDTPPALKSLPATQKDADSMVCMSRNTQDPQYGINHLRLNVFQSDPQVFDIASLQKYAFTLSNYMQFLLAKLPSNKRSLASNIDDAASQQTMEHIISASSLFSRTYSRRVGVLSPSLVSLDTPNMNFGIVRDNAVNLVGQTYSYTTQMGNVQVKIPSQLNLGSVLSLHFTTYYREITSWILFSTPANISSVIVSLESYTVPISSNSPTLNLVSMTSSFEISFPGTFDTSLVVDRHNESRNRYDYVCRYYDTSSRTWNDQIGCTSEITATSTTCSCDSFSGPMSVALQYYPARAVECQSGFSLQNGQCVEDRDPVLEFLETWWYLFVIGLLTCLLLCCLCLLLSLCLALCCRRRYDQRKKKKQKKVEQNLNFDLVRMIQNGDVEIEIEQNSDSITEEMMDRSSENTSPPLQLPRKTPVEILGVKLHDNQDIFNPYIRYKTNPKSSKNQQIIETTTVEQKRKKKRKKNKVMPTPTKSKRLVVFQFRDGIVLDYGRFRSYKNQATCEFMRSVKRGEIPKELSYRSDVDYIYFSVVKVNSVYSKLAYDSRKKYHQKPLNEKSLFVSSLKSENDEKVTTSNPKVAYVEEQIITTTDPASSHPLPATEFDIKSKKSTNQIVRSQIFHQNPGFKKRSPQSNWSSPTSSSHSPSSMSSLNTMRSNNKNIWQQFVELRQAENSPPQILPVDEQLSFKSQFARSPLSKSFSSVQPEHSNSPMRHAYQIESMVQSDSDEDDHSTTNLNHTYNSTIRPISFSDRKPSPPKMKSSTKGFRRYRRRKQDVSNKLPTSSPKSSSRHH